MPILPNWSPKNPLEVIAQFLLLIYGICALLLGFSVTKLAAHNQTTMVVFVVCFPILVLAVFAWLVRNHHTKLYAPSDYRSDDAFLDKPASPAKLGEKLQDETSADDLQQEGGVGVNDTDQPAVGEEREPATDSGGTTQTSQSAVSKNGSAQRNAFLAETLAFQELQSEFGASIRRNIRLKSITGGSTIVDGIIETQSGLAVVEIASISNRPSVGGRVRGVINNLAMVDINSERSMTRLAVFVVPDESFLISVSKSILNQEVTTLGIEVRVFVLPALLEKYGFS